MGGAQDELHEKNDAKQENHAMDLRTVTHRI